ncbi:MAG: hypothetical protein M3R24_26930 [Chloroflexota bacterium]|nr:hypothetical protein [Chloroflexota bacterium]
MAETRLTQAEADALMALEKHSTDDKLLQFPSPGGLLVIPLISADKRENFFLDIRRSQVNLSKITYQNRARQVVVLVRLDVAGPPHRNPDSVELPCPHIHLYREGYGDKWAYPIPVDKFANTADMWQTLHDFYSYCNITKLPLVERGLFS